MSDSVELYKKYRPQKMSDVIGQKEALASLAQMGRAGKIPHFLLLTGPSGCGKTTVARILRDKLGCSDLDWQEINAAESRGIDTVREIVMGMGAAPIGGKCRIWCVDEAHQLTTAAQESFLKPLEDTPPHVYFFFCTTEPKKLIKTITTRATEISFNPVPESDLLLLIDRVVDSEGAKLSDAVAKKISEAADGSPRKALVILHQVLGIEKQEDQLKAVSNADTTAVAFSVAQKLMREGTKWAEMSEILLGLDKNEAESIRWLVLSYARTTLLKSGSTRAAKVIDEFRDNFYDSKDAGLAIACFNVINGKK